jgi:hypothetical protein
MHFDDDAGTPTRESFHQWRSAWVAVQHFAPPQSSPHRFNRVIGRRSSSHEAQRRGIRWRL